jgi:hypothetical protein
MASGHLTWARAREKLTAQEIGGPAVDAVAAHGAGRKPANSGGVTFEAPPL